MLLLPTLEVLIINQSCTCHKLGTVVFHVPILLQQSCARDVLISTLQMRTPRFYEQLSWSVLSSKWQPGCELGSVRFQSMSSLTLTLCYHPTLSENYPSPKHKTGKKANKDERENRYQTRAGKLIHETKVFSLKDKCSQDT